MSDDKQNKYNIMNHQPILNIGCLGSVSDGKSTLVKMLTGIETQQDSREKVKNITINQGFGNMKIFKNKDTFITTDSNTSNIPEHELVNHISFVDCPGHQELIKTMLGALELMNGAIVIVAVDQPITMKPQLAQHLSAAKLGAIDKIIICMNKIDLVDKAVLMKRKYELDTLLKTYDIKPYRIIPTCFNKKIGLNHLVNTIMELFNPDELLDSTKNPIFNISRTFDFNKPGTDWDDVVGGVVGGTLKSGKLKIGDKIEIRPGIISNIKGKISWEPLIVSIVSLKTDTTDLEEAVPGGLIGIGTDLDPFYCKKNALVGHVAGFPDNMPNVFVLINITISSIQNWEPTLKDNVLLKMGTLTCDAKLVIINKKQYKFELSKPVCIRDNENIIICRNINKILTVVGNGILNYSENI